MRGLAYKRGIENAPYSIVFIKTAPFYLPVHIWMYRGEIFGSPEIFCPFPSVFVKDIKGMDGYVMSPVPARIFMRGTGKSKFPVTP